MCWWVYLTHYERHSKALKYDCLLTTVCIVVLIVRFGKIIIRSRLIQNPFPLQISFD